jgi:hypothetical protein
MEPKYNYAEKRVSMGNITRAQADAFEKMPEELKNSCKGNLKNIAKAIGTHDSILSAWLKTSSKETYQYRTTGLYVSFPLLADQASEASENKIPLKILEIFHRSLLPPCYRINKPCYSFILTHFLYFLQHPSCKK